MLGKFFYNKWFLKWEEVEKCWGYTPDKNDFPAANYIEVHGIVEYVQDGRKQKHAVHGMATLSNSGQVVGTPYLCEKDLTNVILKKAVRTPEHPYHQEILKCYWSLDQITPVEEQYSLNSPSHPRIFDHLESQGLCLQQRPISIAENSTLLCLGILVELLRTEEKPKRFFSEKGKPIGTNFKEALEKKAARLGITVTGLDAFRRLIPKAISLLEAEKSRATRKKAE